MAMLRQHVLLLFVSFLLAAGQDDCAVLDNNEDEQALLQTVRKRPAGPPTQPSLKPVFVSMENFEPKPWTIGLNPEKKAVTFSLTAEQRTDFEHLLARAFAKTKGVEWIAKELLVRTDKLIRKSPSPFPGTADSEQIRRMAFNVSDKGWVGWAGDKTEDIDETINHGNSRSRLAYAEASHRTGYGLATPANSFTVDAILQQLCETNSTTEMENLGLNVSYSRKQYNLWKATNKYCSNSEQNCNGNRYLISEPLSSWSRLCYSGPGLSLSSTWKGIRPHPSPNCPERGESGDCKKWLKEGLSESIYPPLSTAERRYQCQGNNKCLLQWEVGTTWYPSQIPSAALQRVPFAKDAPGYLDLADAQGWRVVAGPSGRAAEIMNHAAMLNFTCQELVLLRAAFLPYLVGTDVHSFWEVMLGAESMLGDMGCTAELTARKFMMSPFGNNPRAVLKALAPPYQELQASNGVRFSLSEGFCFLKEDIRDWKNGELLEAMGKDASDFLDGLCNDIMWRMIRYRKKQTKKQKL
eukprot:TRINITY_DN48692_c0_g1_i1.p1 TRINITY_DN48692_c0_g1~~TRINITY_DN48692_c0_g1_i1.p1  ORF type:complete len:523 (-),score=83.72 TRINITY_DN48692_c0_g1_i1:114-1682(-)